MLFSAFEQKTEQKTTNQKIPKQPVQNVETLSEMTKYHLLNEWYTLCIT